MSDLEIKLKEKVHDFYCEIKDVVDNEYFIKLLFCMFLSAVKSCGMNKRETVELIQKLLKAIPADEFYDNRV